jgi:hypothetical protein
VGNLNNLTGNDGTDTKENNDGKPRKTFKSKFLAPKRKPTQIEERRMIGKALEILIISCMKNQIVFYTNIKC